MPEEPPNPNDLPAGDPEELPTQGKKSPRPASGGSMWMPPTPEELAELLPQYRIVALLGRGGMGAVYKGEQATLERAVAIKLLPAELAADGQFIARFQREARTLARLQHPGIVAVYDFGQTRAGHLYFVMEYVDGTDLHQVLRGPGLKPEQAYELIAQICEALHYAHRQGVIHRDIKPANILLNMDGRAKLGDFGLARPLTGETQDITSTNVVMGTPDYMAPEQRAGMADHRADIFALGVMLYEMLTGRTPRGVFEPPSRKAAVDARIDDVVLRALQAEPELRYQEVSELKTDLDRIRTAPLPPVAPPPSRKRERPRRGPLALAAALLVALALCALFGIGGYVAWKDGWLHYEEPEPAQTLAPGSEVPDAEGFISLLDATHAKAWTRVGQGTVNVFEGVAGVRNLRGGHGCFWYTARPFGDFVLKLEYKIEEPGGDSGVFVRFPDPGRDVSIVRRGYQIDITGETSGPLVAGTIHGQQPASAAPFKAQDWNRMEITATGQRYLVAVNGQQVNDFTGDRDARGYIGLQLLKKRVLFRNIRIKELGLEQALTAKVLGTPRPVAAAPSPPPKSTPRATPMPPRPSTPVPATPAAQIAARITPQPLPIAPSSPASPARSPTGRVLFLTYSAAYQHEATRRMAGDYAIAEKALMSAAAGKFIVEPTQMCGAINLSNLRNFDAVVFYTSGELPIDSDGKKALLDFVRDGGGFAGIHSAADTFYTFPDYGEMLGGYLNGHPGVNRLWVKVEDRNSPATAGLGEAFEIAHEAYQFKNWKGRSDTNILLSIDPRSTSLMRTPALLAVRGNAGADYPIAWTRSYGVGRVFYTALGHNVADWVDARFLRHVVGGIQSVLKSAPATPAARGATPARVLPSFSSLREALLGGPWTWSGLQGRTLSWSDVRFQSDGAFLAFSGRTMVAGGRWKQLAPNLVELSVASRRVSLVFEPGFAQFVGTDEAGMSRYQGARRP